MKIYKDYTDLVEGIILMLARLDAEHANWETDIYLYATAESGWTLDTIMNIGGCSWRNDSHILLYRDKPHYEDMPEWAEGMSTEQIAEELLATYEEEYRAKAQDILDEWDLLA